MKKLMIGLVAAVAMAGCCTQPCDGIKDSGTTYMADALAPYIEKGELPGAKRKECGNYLEHDLPGARKTAADMLTVLRDWTEERLAYSE